MSITLSKLKQLWERDEPLGTRIKLVNNVYMREMPLVGDFIEIESLKNPGVGIYLLVTKVMDTSAFIGYYLEQQHNREHIRHRHDLKLQIPLHSVKMDNLGNIGARVTILHFNDDEQNHPANKLSKDIEYDGEDDDNDEDRMSDKLLQGEAGYINPPDKKIWPASGKGIRCGTCIYFQQTDITTLSHCAVVRDYVHGHGCCNLWSHDYRPDVSQFINGDEIDARLANNLDW